MTDDDIYSEPPPLMDGFMVLHRNRGSFLVQIMRGGTVSEEICFSNADHLLRWQHGELLGPRIVRPSADRPTGQWEQIPGPPEPEASLVTRLGRAAGLKRGAS